MKVKYCLEALDIVDAARIPTKRIKEFQKVALACIDGIGDSYDVMMSAVVLAEALLSEREAERKAKAELRKLERQLTESSARITQLETQLETAMRELAKPVLCDKCGVTVDEGSAT